MWLQCPDRLLRDIQNNDIVFGGKVLILGNLQQILPVLHAARATIIENYLISCTLWDSFDTFVLTENIQINPGWVEFNLFLTLVQAQQMRRTPISFKFQVKFHSNPSIRDLIKLIYDLDIANLS